MAYPAERGRSSELLRVYFVFQCILSWDYLRLCGVSQALTILHVDQLAIYNGQSCIGYIYGSLG